MRRKCWQYQFWYWSDVQEAREFQFQSCISQIQFQTQVTRAGPERNSQHTLLFVMDISRVTKNIKEKEKIYDAIKEVFEVGRKLFFLTRAVLAVTATGWRSAKWHIFVKANISPKTWIVKYSKCVNWICQVYPAKIQQIRLEKLNTWPSTHRYEAVTTELCETCNLNRRWWSESKAFGCAKTSSTNICFQGSWSVKSQGYCDVVSVKKSPLLKCFPSTIKRKSGVFKFVWFEERFPFSKKFVFATA